MKKIIVTFMILALISAAYAVVFEIENESEKILVTLINQEPDPVEPGSIVEVNFRIENLRSQAAQNMEVMVETKFPFSIYGNQENIQQVGSLAPLQGGDLGVKVEYKLLVDKSAAEGDNEVLFMYRTDGGAWVKAAEFTIDVGSRDAVLAINEIKTDSDRIAPRSMSKVTFVLDNLAGSALKDIKLKLDLKESVVTTTSVAVTELPFSPVGSSNEKTIRRINPKSSEEIVFNFFTDADAVSKVYKVPFTLTYSDDANNDFSRTGHVGLMVDAEPDLSITLDSTTVYSAGTKGNVVVKFVNKGFSDIKFLNVILKQTEDYEIVSNKEDYIGNVDSDDYETAEFEIIVNSKNDVLLPLKVEYKSANGETYSQDIQLNLPLFSGKELKQRQGEGGSPLIGVVVIVVIVVAGFLFWRWRKKRKNAS